MKNRIISILISMSLMASCKCQVSEIYVGELDSGVKHIRSSSLELIGDNMFKLIQSTTSLESKIPSTHIIELEGEFKKEKDRLYLFTKTQKSNWVSYGKNPDTLNMNTRGIRKTALIAIDTLYGQKQIIKDSKLVEYNLTSRSNSKYIWNDKNCFMKFENTEVSDDLKNYCSDITNSTIDTNDLDGMIFYWEDTEDKHIMFPKKSIIEFEDDKVIILDYPFDPAGMMNYSSGTYQIKNDLVEIIIEKSVTFSMNIGQVIWFTKNCHNKLKLSMISKGKLIREKSEDRLNFNIDGEQYSENKNLMTYKQYDGAHIPISYNWTSKLKYYDNIEKLKNCK